MRRLVYSPKVYAFIRSSNLDGRIFNVTSDIVSGTVTRNVNDLSTASLVLRNRYFKWIVYKNQLDTNYHGKQIFLPMDMITIWLQRIGGKPIQVFTGYLDSVPYYQMYPGNCNITASCTLKKLAFEWFDPGLDFFQSWVNSEPGWLINPATGDANNLVAQQQLSFPNAGTLGAEKTAVTDGGFAKLIYDFMTQIAAWDAKDVVVSQLPADLPAVAASMYSLIETNTQESLDQLTEAMGVLMGVNYTPPGTNPDGTTKDPNTATTQQIFNGLSNNIPPIVAVAAALATTALNPNFKSSANAPPGYGLYAMSPDKPGTKLANLTIGGTLVTDILGDVGTATFEFCDAAFKASFNKDGTRKAYVAAVHNGSPTTQKAEILKWINDVYPNNSNFTTGDFDSKFSAAVALVKNMSTLGSGTSANSPNPTTSSGDITWKSAELTKQFTAQDKRYLASYTSGGGNDVLAGVLYQAKAISKDLSLDIDPGLVGPKNPDIIYISGTSADVGKFVRAFYGAAGASVEQVAVSLSGLPGSSGIIVLHNGKKVSGEENVPSVNNMAMVYTTERPSLVAKSNTANKTSGGVSFEDLGTISQNAAFAAQLSFPVNVIESQYLQGNKSLMNDTSCLDAVRQFCQASMRNFMSLPDGRFLAFYPDYFGAHDRKPYWWIHNSEIVDMGIQLNDDALATHVYVVGDLAGAGAGSISEIRNEVGTRGVATISQANILNGFIDPNGQTLLGRLENAYEFLQHYGARPHKEDEPLIRNTFYEFLLAWQRFMQLWAGQFQTMAEFTFQPEVFAGGIIGFPEHNLQVYVESVTHTFDYESGFYTNAVISSPAELHPSGDGSRGRSTPGFALAGNVNTVAGGALG